MTVIRKLALALIRDRKVLHARSKGKDLFYNLGGKPEIGENDLQSLSREVHEETGARFIVQSASYLFTQRAPAHGKPAGTILETRCYQGEIEGELAPSAEVEELDWFTSADRERTTVMGQRILEQLYARNLID